MRPLQVGFGASLLFLVHSASIANDVANLPPCGLPCWTSAITKSGCGLTDYVCQCSATNSNFIVPLTGNCLLSSSGCSSADVVTFAELSDDICSQVSLGSTVAGTATSVASSVAVSTAGASTTALSTAVSSTISGYSTQQTSNAAQSSKSASQTTAAAATNAPSTTATTSAVPVASSGISTGAIAGIAVGGVIVVALIGVGIFLCLRRRRKARLNQSGLPPTTFDPSKGVDPELMSPANAQEMGLEKQPKYELLSPSTPASELHSKTVSPVASELYSSPISPAPAELPTEATAYFARKPVPSRDVPDIKLTVASPTTPVVTPTSAALAGAAAGSEGDAGEGSQDEAKLKILRDRIDKIRDEKARLERLQELKDLEEQTKMEIMAEQRRAGGGY